MEPPQFPAGPVEPLPSDAMRRRSELIATIENAPAELRRIVSPLSQSQLDTRYKNWTIRQIIHHIADSHVNSYIRFKWALTEDRPTIKAYDDGRWAELADSRAGDIQAPLALLDGLHACWVQLLRAMSAEQYQREFIHPDTGKTINLIEALHYYAWHCRHHTAQIAWRQKQHDW